MSNISTPNERTRKISFKLQQDSEHPYNFTLFNKEDDLTFNFEDIKDFPVKIFELKISLKELKELDENFFIFKNTEKLMNGIKTCVESEKYLLKYDEKENCIIFEIKNDFFENGSAKIKIPEKEQDLKTQVDCLTKIIAEMKKELNNYKNNEKSKEEAAVKSFNGTSFLNDDEKKLISKWIHPNKVLKFNMLFNTAKDGDSASTFHYYCDGIFPTVTVIVDTAGRRFGGYSTHSWRQPSAGAVYSRAPESFIFNLSNKQKYDLFDQAYTNGIYKNNSYGPTFGGGYDLCLCNSGKSNTSNYCNKSSYNTGNNNLLGGTGSTNFQVSNYEVYHVLFE